MQLTQAKRSFLLLTLLLLQILCCPLSSFAAAQPPHTAQDIICETSTCQDTCDQQELTQEEPLLEHCSTAITCVFAINAVAHSLPSKLPQPAYAIFVPPQ